MQVRVTERDDSLPHQIRLKQDGTRRFAATCVGCTCKREPLGSIPNSGDPWAIYNRPELHDNSRVQFEPRAHHDQNVKVYEIE